MWKNRCLALLSHLWAIPIWTRAREENPEKEQKKRFDSKCMKSTDLLRKLTGPERKRASQIGAVESPFKSSRTSSSQCKRKQGQLGVALGHSDSEKVSAFSIFYVKCLDVDLDQTLLGAAPRRHMMLLWKTKMALQLDQCLRFVALQLRWRTTARLLPGCVTFATLLLWTARAPSCVMHARPLWCHDRL